MGIVINVFLKRVWWQQVLLILSIAIVGIQIAGTIGTKFLVPLVGWGESHSVFAASASDDKIEGRFARWDSSHYLRIAQEGYSDDGRDLVFFPLYPFLIYLLNNTLGLSILWSGLIVALACFLGAGLLLYRLIQIDYASEIALWSVAWLSVFPMSFFFASQYTESLFLLTSIAAMYFARRGQFIASGLAIALAGATRPTAFLLAIPFFLEIWQHGRLKQIKLTRVFIGTLIAPLGVLAFSFYIILTRDTLNIVGLYSSIEREAFQRYLAWPWVTFYDALKAAMFGNGFTRVIAWHDLGYALLGMVGAIYGLFRLRLSTALYFLVNMIFLYSNHGPSGLPYLSISRYIAVLFPIYLILALVTTKLPKHLRWLPVLMSVCLLGILSAWYATGRWVA